MVTPQDVYARHLVSRRGYPLWTPEPSPTLPDIYREQGLKIGDVGVVVPEDGSFDVLFNICLPSTHTLHQRAGVPDNFESIQLEEHDIARFTQAESTGRVISTSSVARVDRQTSSESTRDTQPGLLDYEFTLSSKEGSLLILPEGAERCYLRNQRPFLEKAIRHAFEWYDFAEQRLGRIIGSDSLYLVTGFYKARSWSLASYQQASDVGGVYAQFKTMQDSGSDISSNYTWETTHTLDWRVGPSSPNYNNEIANQSVFIQGFKIAVRDSIRDAKRAKVKAEYNGLGWSDIRAMFLSSWFTTPAADTPIETDDTGMPGEYTDSNGVLDDAGGYITIQHIHIPQASKPFHPSDVINQYLLRTCPLAMIAITHDTLWSTLFPCLKPEELVQEGRLEALVDNMSPVFQEGAVYLENVAFNAETATYELIEDAMNLFGYVGKRSPRPGVTTIPGEELDASDVEVQSSDSCEGSSSSETLKPRKLSLHPTPARGAAHEDHTVRSAAALVACPDRNPIGINGSKPQPPGSSSISLSIRSPLPNDPSLPTSLSPAISAPSTSMLSTQPSSTARQPAKPLKSILKGSKGTQSHDSHAETGGMPSNKKVTRFLDPCVSRPETLLIPMEPSASDLHWQLCPYDPRRSKRLLRFDIALPVDEIAFQSRRSRRKLSDADLNKLAVDGGMTRMLITFEHKSFSWKVDVKNANGICCRDVFEAIYKAFNQPLTLEGRGLVRDRGAVEEALRLRHGYSPSGSEVGERSLGWKKVDILLPRTIFLGLTQAKPGGDWVLHLGTPRDIADRR